jgi:hypothetical protein
MGGGWVLPRWKTRPLELDNPTRGRSSRRTHSSFSVSLFCFFLFFSFSCAPPVLVTPPRPASSLNPNLSRDVASLWTRVGQHLVFRRPPLAYHFGICISSVQRRCKGMNNALHQQMTTSNGCEAVFFSRPSLQRAPGLPLAVVHAVVIQ